MSDSAPSIVDEHWLPGQKDVAPVVRDVLRVLLANLLLHPNEAKYRTLREANPTIARAIALPGVRQWLTVCGFVRCGSNADVTYEFRGNGPTLALGDDLLSRFEQAVRVEEPSSSATGRIEQRRSEATTTRAAATPQSPLTSVPKRDRELDVLSPSDPLMEQVSRTVHRKGRLRNAYCDARDTTLRRMTTWRALLCGCPPNNLELHFHTRNSTFMYAFIIHVSADGTNVVHVGPELGYQYASIPGTSHFKKTVFMSEKTVDEAGVVTCIQQEKVCDGCGYCNVPFGSLWV